MKKRERKKVDPVKKVFKFGEKMEYKKISEFQYSFTGNEGYEAVLINKRIREGTFLLGFNFEAQVKNSNARIGIYNHGLKSKSKRNKIFCLGSNIGSYAMRLGDAAILENGQILDAPFPDNRQEVKSLEEGEDYYILVSINDPKKPELIRKYKKTIDHKELFYNPNSSISFFSATKGYLGSIYNLKEGVYSLGFCLYKKGKVTVNLLPDLGNVKSMLENVRKSWKGYLMPKLSLTKSMKNKYSSALDSSSILSRTWYPYKPEEDILNKKIQNSIFLPIEDEQEINPEE